MRFCSDVRESLCCFGHVDLFGSKVGAEEQPEITHKQNSEQINFIFFHYTVKNGQET
jgi:hypothetical protein